MKKKKIWLQVRATLKPTQIENGHAVIKGTYHTAAPSDGFPVNMPLHVDVPAQWTEEIEKRPYLTFHVPTRTLVRVGPYILKKPRRRIPWLQRFRIPKCPEV